MKREFHVVIEQDEDGYFVASVSALRGCHTQAKSLDVLMERVKEAIALCIEVEEPVSNSPRLRDHAQRTSENTLNEIDLMP